MDIRLTLLVFACFVALGSPSPLTMTALGQVHLYGGSGTLEGRFETAVGDIDLQGWEGSECPEVGFESLWQVSTFQAENLNSHGPGNHAMWAGRTEAQRPFWEDPPGYGDNWNTVLLWSKPAPTTESAFDVQLDAVFNHDVEVFYDNIYIEWNQGGVWQILDQFDSTSADGSDVFQPPGVVMFYQWTVQPSDLVDGEVQIRIRVESDPVVSDQSGTVGANPGDSDGAIQIDDITVSFDGVPVDGGGDADGLATFENGDDEGWTPQLDTCSCSIVSELPGDVDPGPDNLTPQIGLFRSSAYPGTQAISCKFESPIIDWDVPEAEGLDATRVRLRAYRESAGGNDRWFLYVRSRVGGQWHDFFLELIAEVVTPATGWRTYDFVITELIPVSAEAIRLMIIPAAYSASEMRMTFDDVEVVRFDSTSTSAPPTASPGNIELDVYPSPANPSATIRYTLDMSSSVTIALFDAHGRRVRTVFEGTKPPGRHTLLFDGLDDAGRSVASGIYYVRLMANDGRTSGDRVVIIR